jgi:cyclic-di-GMP-binding protein
MPAPSSFDVTSTVDLAEVDNAINQARKEIAQRYDFKGSTASIEFKKPENTITLLAEDTLKMDALWEILQTRLVRRNVPVKNLKLGDVEHAAGSSIRRVVTLQQGISGDAARDIVKYLKDQKLRKVQTTIQGDQLRISSPSKDELQDVMRLLRAHDFGIALQFGNYR